MGHHVAFESDERPLVPHLRAPPRPSQCEHMRSYRCNACAQRCRLLPGRAVAQLQAFAPVQRPQSRCSRAARLVAVVGCGEDCDAGAVVLDLEPLVFYFVAAHLRAHAWLHSAGTQNQPAGRRGMGRPADAEESCGSEPSGSQASGGRDRRWRCSVPAAPGRCPPGSGASHPRQTQRPRRACWGSAPAGPAPGRSTASRRKGPPGAPGVGQPPQNCWSFQLLIAPLFSALKFKLTRSKVRDTTAVTFAHSELRRRAQN